MRLQCASNTSKTVIVLLRWYVCLCAPLRVLNSEVRVLFAATSTEARAVGGSNRVGLYSPVLDDPCRSFRGDPWMIDSMPRAK